MTDGSLTEMSCLSETVIGAAIEVHRELGPGFTEACYEMALSTELTSRGIAHARQVDLPVFYKNAEIGRIRLDIVVDHRLALELKAVEVLIGLHQMQLLSYLKATGLTLGLLINFNTTTLTRGVRRVVHHFPEPLRPSALSASPR